MKTCDDPGNILEAAPIHVYGLYIGLCYESCIIYLFLFIYLYSLLAYLTGHGEFVLRLSQVTKDEINDLPGSC